MVATFNETRAPAYTKYIAEQSIVMPNWSKIIQTYRSHSSVFALEKQPKNVNFQSFLPLIDLLGGTFNETGAQTSIKYAAEQAIKIPNWSKTFQTFWSHFPVFAIEKLLKN